MITLFLTICYYLVIWPFVILFKLIIWPFKLMFQIAALPFHLLGWLVSAPGRILFPERYGRADQEDTMDDFLDWGEEYECLTDDD